MRSLRLFIAAALLVSAAARLQAEDGPAGPGATHLNVPVSVRQAGMGGVSTGGDDLLRSWTNPAALAAISRRGEVALAGGKTLAEGTASSFGAGWRLNRDWTAGAFFYRHALEFPLVDQFGDELSDVAVHAITSGGVSGSWTRRWFTAGLTIKSVTETILDDTATTGAADLGVAGRWGNFDAGLAMRNLGGAIRPGDEAIGVPEELLPTEFRLGASWRYAPWRLRLMFETAKTTELPPDGGLGVEWWPVEALAIRLGGSGGADERRITGGLSVVWRQFGFDYAVVAQDIGPQHRAALSFRFGPAAEGMPVPEDRPRQRKPEPEPEAPATAPRSAGDKQLNFAVADLRAENVSAGDAAVMADLLRSELVRTNAFNVVEKQNMEKVLSEHAFQQTGCSTEECAVKLGKLLNVQRMAVGSFGKLLDSYFLNVRVVDIETGKVKYADSAEGTTVAELKDGVQKMAKRMAAQVR